MSKILVTGGAGYFGEIVSQKLLDQGHSVRVFDLNCPSFEHPKLEFIRGDIREPDTVNSACEGMEVVHHNVAQVPLAKDRNLFWSVNYEGTRVLLEAARASKVTKMVYTSSSAVFGIPSELPVTADTLPSPAEDYGRAKLKAEELCLAARRQGLDVSIIRPRTILGHGRLGIFQILFDWIHRGDPVPVFSGGNNRYQFVHADDLANACLAAGFKSGPGTYNIGSHNFGTMRELLTQLIEYAGTSSIIVSVPMSAMTKLMGLASWLGMSPLGPYHALMYGREMYFDLEPARQELGYAPRYSDADALASSYDSYVSNAGNVATNANRSYHQSSLKKQLVAATPFALKLLSPFAR